jgi:hypothetical protein
MIYIGIDGGPSGGIVALSPMAGVEPILTARMPTVKQGRARLVDDRAVVSLLRNLPWPTDGLHIVIEDLPHHSMSKAAMRSMVLNFGRLTSAIEARLQCDRIMVQIRAGGEFQAKLATGDVECGRRSEAIRRSPHPTKCLPARYLPSDR